MKPSKIFLIGLPASGKTTCGRKIAEELKAPFVDLDEEIEKEAGQSISKIFENDGEAKFRQLESQTLQKIISSQNEFVMATGGGTPCFDPNLDLMNRHGLTIYINPPLETIQERLKGSSSRPLMKHHTLKELHDQRVDWYLRAKHVVKDYDELVALLTRT